MKKHSTNPWARLRVLLMLPAVAFSAVVASACKNDANSTEDLNFNPQDNTTIHASAIATWDVVEIEEADTSEVFMVVEDQPEFPGGTQAMMEFFQSNITYPESCKKDSIQGRVIVTFVVEKDGSISNVKVITPLFPPCDEEVLRVISSMPKWIPARNKGVPVRSFLQIPVTFRMR